MNPVDVTPSAGTGRSRWPLLPKSVAGDHSPLLLVVHGQSGGQVPEVLLDLVSDLVRGRQAPVWMQALTADPLDLPHQGLPLVLVPLLLTPGSHVRSDVPAIRQRLRDQGHRVQALPFLGAWGPWLEHLRGLAAPAVLHHPLRPGVADRYIAALSAYVGVPFFSADRSGEGDAAALPLALAPNRMTAHLQAEASPCLALLERPATRQFLLNLLLDLP